MAKSRPVPVEVTPVTCAPLKVMTVFSWLSGTLCGARVVSTVSLWAQPRQVEIASNNRQTADLAIELFSFVPDGTLHGLCKPSFAIDALLLLLWFGFRN
uniref:Uncharacterized protein n=1 Tax=Citrifermentans bremense TaxID=60035 RepID=A0A6S6M399_9BACT